MADESSKNPQQHGTQNPNDPQNKNRQQQDIDQSNDMNQDPSKKAPGQDVDRKDREGSDDVEKRRAS